MAACGSSRTRSTSTSGGRSAPLRATIFSQATIERGCNDTGRPRRTAVAALVDGSSNPQEVRQQFRPFQCQETLRVELDAMQRPSPVSDAHDLAFRRPGAYLEVRILERLTLDDQAVVARRLERARQAGE